MRKMRALPPLAALLLGLAWAGPSAAAGPDSVRLRYQAYWSGLHAADIVLGVDGNGAGYDTTMRIATRGIIGWLLKLDFTAQGAARQALPGDLASAGYRTHYHTRRGERRMVVEFDPATGIGTRVLDQVVSGEGYDRDEQEEALPVELRRDVLDPLSALVEMRDKVRAAMDGGPATFTLRNFDGKRRYDLEGEVLGRGAKTIGQHRHETVEVRLTMRTIAGFRKRHEDLWNETQFQVSLDPQHLLPLRIQTDMDYGSTVITAVESCPPARACQLAQAR